MRETPLMREQQKRFREWIDHEHSKEPTDIYGRTASDRKNREYGQ